MACAIVSLIIKLYNKLVSEDKYMRKEYYKVTF